MYIIIIVYKNNTFLIKIVLVTIAQLMCKERILPECVILDSSKLSADI